MINHFRRDLSSLQIFRLGFLHDGIGKSAQRIDAIGKVTGQTQYWRHQPAGPVMKILTAHATCAAYGIDTPLRRRWMA
jgi:hypothetical protein